MNKFTPYTPFPPQPTEPCMRISPILNPQKTFVPIVIIFLILGSFTSIAAAESPLENATSPLELETSHNTITLNALSGVRKAAKNTPPTASNDLGFNPFNLHIHWNADLQLGGIPWQSTPTAQKISSDVGAWHPFFVRLSVGALFKLYYDLFSVNITASHGIDFAAGVQLSYTSLVLGLWTQASFEVGANNQLIGSIGAGFSVVGIEYQQDFSKGLKGNKSLSVLVRIPIGIIVSSLKTP